MRVRRILPVLLVALALPHAARGADKEHQQLMAEIRMLQEQQMQLQQMIGGLADALKGVTTKLDEQAAASRKVLADQGLQLNGLNDGMRVLREKVDDTNVRISSLAQQVEGVRQAVVSLPPPATLPGAELPPGEPGAVPPETTPGQPPAVNPNPIPSGVSPVKMWDAAFADYAAGQYDLAVLGFESYIKAFPQTPQAAQAQLYIGQARQLQSNWPEALKAFQAVTIDYPESDSAPAAYYKMGQTYERLDQVDLARKAYQTTIDKYPRSNDASLARQAIERLNRR